MIKQNFDGANVFKEKELLFSGKSFSYWKHIWKQAILLPLLIVLAMFNSSVKAQYSNNVIPPGPIASSFKLYGDIPVSLNTGVPDITIPLYTIKVGDFELPIELKYHIKSVKPSGCKSNVALGWSLHYGGTFTTSIYGALGDGNPYDLNQGYGEDPDDPSYVNIYNGMWVARQEQLSLVVDKRVDTEHDIYHYIIGNESGEFILNEGTPYPLGGEPLKITCISKDVDIINSKGVLFKFGYGKYGRVINWLPGEEAGNTKYLSEIVLPSGENLSYTYNDIPLWSDIPSDFMLQTRSVEEVFSTDVASQDHGVHPPNFTGTYVMTCGATNGTGEEKSIFWTGQAGYEEKNVKEIVFPNGKIVFDLSTDNKIIKGLTVFQGTKKLIQYEFTLNESGSMEGMYLLSEVKIKDGVGSDIGKYTMDYNSKRNIGTVNTDHWGYYNGEDGNNFFPFNNYTAKGIDGITDENYCSSQSTNFSRSFGKSKNAVYGSCLVNTLNKITYPTKGYTQFEYELNTFTTGAGVIEQGDGLRIRTITSNDGQGNNIIKSYEYTPPVLPQITINDYTTKNFTIGETNLVKKDIVKLKNETYLSKIAVRGAESRFGVRYGSVTEYNGNQLNNAGKSIYNFIYNNDVFEWQPLDIHPDWYLAGYKGWGNGLLSSKQVYDNNSSIPKLTISYDYEYHEGTKFKNTRVFLLCSYPNASSESPVIGRTLYTDFFYKQKKTTLSYTDYPFPYGLIYYDIISGWSELKSETKTEQAGAGTITTKTEYEYNGAKNYYPSKITTYGSKNNSEQQETKVIECTYPYDYPSDANLNALVENNIISPVVQQSEYYNGNEHIKTTYTSFGANLKPVTVNVKYGDAPIYNVMTFDSYDTHKKLTQYHKNNDVITSFIWGYNYTLPIAKIDGTDFNTAMSKLSKTYAELQLMDGTALQGELNNLRSIPNALITTYTYAPLIGMTSQTDPNGITTYYEYDDFGRLKNVRDNDNNIIKRNYYHYYNETTSDGICTLDVSGTLFRLLASATSASFTITSGCRWTISEDADWLTLSQTSGSGNATITVNATANGSTSRTAIITVNSGSGLTKTINVRQSGALGTISVDASELWFGNTSSLTNTLAITTSTSWVVSSYPGWLTIKPASGTGSMSVTITAARAASGSRIGTIVFSTADGSASVTLPVTQSNNPI
jgi:YD repeat-containing protein